MVAKVEIPKGLLIGLVGVAAAGVLGMVFLLGRETGRGAPLERRRDSTSTAASQGSAIPASPKTAVAEEPIAEPASSGQPVAVHPGPPIPLGDPARVAVAAYFLALETIQPGSSGDPETMAQQVVAGLGKGDTSGFDAMIQQAQAAKDRLSAIAPPPPCAAYHRESLASLEAGLGLMRAMKRALSSPEQDMQMSNLTDQANALKARSEALQRHEKALRERFGLMQQSN